MLIITYTNGDIQNVNVTGDFFAVTLAPKNGSKPVKISPIEKAEDMAFDNALKRGLEVAKIELLYPGGEKPKLKIFKPVDEKEVEEKAKPTKAFIKELKKAKKAGKLQFKEKRYQRWVWNF